MHRPQPNYNIGSMILRRGTLNPDRTALIFEDTTTTYADLANRVRRLAAGLSHYGVCRGDRVAYLGVNHPDFIDTMLAAWSIGAIFVPLNFRLTGPELAYMINDAGIHTLFVDDSLRPVIEPVRDDLCCRVFVAAESDAPHWLSKQSLSESYPPLQDLYHAGQHDTAVIMYTSGTTGKPKGAMLSHGNLFWNNAASALDIHIHGDDISLVAAPLFHIGGLNVTLLGALQNGTVVVLHRAFDAGQALTDIEKHAVTVMFGAPAMFLFMAQQPQFDDTDLSSLRMLIVGAAPVPRSLLEIYGKRNVSLNQGYGLTETAPFVSFLTSEHLEAKMGSAGKPGLLGEILISDADGNAVPDGEVGEILYRGANVMQGYWNKPDATSEAIDSKGWFHTGDAGYIDSDGFLFISDRVKDMVISGGENVYPAEVESVMFEHPAIAEVAVIGVPDEKWGEAVSAVVACHEGQSLNLEELRGFCDGKLARYKLPLRLFTVAALPRNPAGKVLKFELREQFGDESSA
ncbi:MAG: long-chain fatty acid--CoA ligase [Pseudomonadota bacterium]